MDSLSASGHPSPAVNDTLPPTHPIQVSILTLSPLDHNPALFFSPQLVPSTDYFAMHYYCLTSPLREQGLK